MQMFNLVVNTQRLKNKLQLMKICRKKGIIGFISQNVPKCTYTINVHTLFLKNNMS